MSGHSKWSTIKRKKGAIDTARSKVFQKLSKEIYVAAKSGDASPDMNPTLRVVVEKAKSANMPKDKIKAAIDKAHNKHDNVIYDEIRYEGYAPGGVAIIIDCLTDNKNRTAASVRASLTKQGGNLGTDGSVAYLFHKKGIIVLQNNYDEDELMMKAIEAGAEDFLVEEDLYIIYTTPEEFVTIKGSLNINEEDLITSEITYIPENYIELEASKKEKVLELIELLEDNDDVQSVYHNMKE